MTQRALACAIICSALAALAQPPAQQAPAE